MGTFFGILVIIFLAWLLLRPLLAPYLQRWFMHSMENRLRRMAGMPSRKEEKRQRKRRTSYSQSNRQTHKSKTREPIIPKEYAEDVEFVEIKSYSETTIISGENPKGEKKTKIVVESQIEDVEFVEYKNE